MRVFWRNTMVRMPRTLAFAMTLFAASMLVPRNANAFDLTGAWASQSDLCGLVFTKKDGKVVFAELSDLYGSGFVIEGKSIRGRPRSVRYSPGRMMVQISSWPRPVRPRS